MRVTHSVFTQKWRTGGDPYPALREVPLFAASDNHAGLQVADLVASTLVLPMAASAYGPRRSGPHYSPRYGEVRRIFGTRVRDVQHRYRDETGRWRGGWSYAIESANGQDRDSSSDCLRVRKVERTRTRGLRRRLDPREPGHSFTRNGQSRGCAPFARTSTPDRSAGTIRSPAGGREVQQGSTATEAYDCWHPRPGAHGTTYDGSGDLGVAAGFL